MRTHAHGPTDSNRNTPLSLDQILSFFRDLDVDPTKVRFHDINFAYSAMFGLEWSDPETEQLRTEFLRKVGPDSGRHLCKYALHHHPLDRFSDGFTDDDLELLLGRLTIAVIMLLHHLDLAPQEFRLELGIRGGALFARLPDDAPGGASNDREVLH